MPDEVAFGVSLSFSEFSMCFFHCRGLSFFLFFFFFRTSKETGTEYVTPAFGKVQH